MATVSVSPHSANFERAFQILLGHEGGFVDHPADPGGATRWGISRRSYPDEDIRNLTVERARAIYHRDYWTRCHADELPGPLALLVFDAAVNCGVPRSVKWLQQAVGATADGAFGPATRAAVEAAIRRQGGGAVCRDVLVSRLMFHVSLPTWRTFGLGWARRIVSLPFSAVQMATEPGHHGV